MCVINSIHNRGYRAVSSTLLHSMIDTIPIFLLYTLLLQTDWFSMMVQQWEFIFFPCCTFFFDCFCYWYCSCLPSCCCCCCCCWASTQQLCDYSYQLKSYRVIKFSVFPFVHSIWRVCSHWRKILQKKKKRKTETKKNNKKRI